MAAESIGSLELGAFYDALDAASLDELCRFQHQLLAEYAEAWAREESTRAASFAADEAHREARRKEGAIEDRLLELTKKMKRRVQEAYAAKR